MELTDLVRSANETLEAIRASLETRNETPSVAPAAPVTKGVEDQPTPTAPSRRLMTRSDMFDLRSSLRTKSVPELHMLFAEQARRRDVGIPFESWANAGGTPVQNAIEGNELLAKALDTGGAAALIRQDLEPILYELYVREFPAWERFPKEPANGLVHAYNQITAYGDAQFMTELGTVTDDKNTYARQTTNVAIVATRRGLSLKSQFAVQAGGMGYNPEQLELTGGLRAIAHKMQKTLFQGNATVSGGTADDENGLYDANGFTGLRYTLSNTGTGATRVVGVDITTTPQQDMRAKIDEACGTVADLGGKVSIIWGRTAEKRAFDLQQDKNVRYMAPESLVNVGVGVLTNAVNTVFGPLPFAVVPGDSIGSYDVSSSEIADLYLLDESTITMPYLGTDGPTVLDIPIGISGQLTHLYIIFGMWGLAVKALPFSNKVQVTIGAS